MRNIQLAYIPIFPEVLKIIHNNNNTIYMKLLYIQIQMINLNIIELLLYNMVRCMIPFQIALFESP